MEQQNYYEILDLSREASLEDILRSYKHLSLKYHPLKSHADNGISRHKFNQVCEAFDVLYNCKFELLQSNT